MRHYSPPLAEALTSCWDGIAAASTASIALRDARGLVAGRRETVPHYAASTVKLAVLIAALAEAAAGRLDLARSVTVRDEFPSAAGGRFVLRLADDQDDATWDRRGADLPLGALMERMVVDSSNIATNLLLQEVTLDAVGRVLTRAGAGGMAMRHYIGDDAVAGSGRGNTVTADGLARLLGLLATGRLLSPEATQRAMTLLARQTHRSMIPAGLPPGTWSAGKPGWTAAVDHDVQLVRPVVAPEYVLAVCTTTGASDEAHRLIARISAVTWEHWTAWHAS